MITLKLELHFSEVYTWAELNLMSTNSVPRPDGPPCTVLRLRICTSNQSQIRPKSVFQLSQNSPLHSGVSLSGMSYAQDPQNETAFARSAAEVRRALIQYGARAPVPFLDMCDTAISPRAQSSLSPLEKPNVPFGPFTHKMSGRDSRSRRSSSEQDHFRKLTSLLFLVTAAAAASRDFESNGKLRFEGRSAGAGPLNGDGTGELGKEHFDFEQRNEQINSYQDK